MRTPLALAALIFAASCATTAPTATTPAASTPTRSSSALAGMLATAGQPNAATAQAIERAMGPADIRRQDGAGLALTYRLEHCALLLLFAADAQNEMRLAVSHASARQSGGPAPSFEQCAEEARARR